MLLASHLVNLMILLPLLLAFATQPEALAPSFGPDTDARRILICLYATIALCSLLALVLLALGHATLARQISVTLFGLQIVYKLMTVALLGFGHGVVSVNLLVVALHSATLLTLWLHQQS